MGPLPPNAAAPPARPRRPSPTPRQRGPGGPTAVARRRRKDGAVTGGGGVWQARGGPVGRPGAAKQKSGPRGLWPLGPALSGRFAPSRRPPALGFAPLPRWSRGNGVPGGEGVRHGACASCAGGRCPRFYGSSPGDRRSADRTYRKGTGGPPAFQRGKGRY